MTIRNLLIAGLILSTSGAHAGWFGPSNYRECLLDEMKGKQTNLLPVVKGLCNERFPCAKPAESVLAREEAECAKWRNEEIKDPLYNPYMPHASDYCATAAKLACIGGNLD